MGRNPYDEGESGVHHRALSSLSAGYVFAARLEGRQEIAGAVSLWLGKHWRARYFSLNFQSRNLINTLIFVHPNKGIRRIPLFYKGK